MKYHTASSPKMYALSEALKVRLPEAIGIVFLLEALVALHWPEGNIYGTTLPFIAKSCEWHGTPQDLLDGLVKAKIVEHRKEKDGGYLVLVDWNLNCPEYVNRRKRREDARRDKFEG